MALDAGKIIIPGRGNVLVGEPDADPIDPGQFLIGAPATYGTLLTLGHTSRENTVALEKEGGDVTQVGTWEVEAADTSTEATAWTLGVNALQADQATFELVFPGGEWDPVTESYDVGDIGAVEKSVQVIMVQGLKRLSFFCPRVSLSVGDAPTIDVENFFEFNLLGQILSSNVTGKRFRWFGTRTYAAPVTP